MDEQQELYIAMVEHYGGEDGYETAYRELAHYRKDDLIQALLMKQYLLQAVFNLASKQTKQLNMECNK